MPTPPKESIGGSHPRQISAFEFSKTTYAYLIELEDLINSPDFETLDQAEKDLISAELTEQTKSYEILWERVNNY